MFEERGQQIYLLPTLTSFPVSEALVSCCHSALPGHGGPSQSGPGTAGAAVDHSHIHLHNVTFHQVVLQRPGRHISVLRCVGLVGVPDLR